VVDHGCSLHVFISPTLCMHCLCACVCVCVLFVPLCVVTKPSFETTGNQTCCVRLATTSPPSAGNTYNLFVIQLCSQMPSPPHCLRSCLWRLCSQMPDRRIACTRFLCDCARICSPRRIACTCFLGGCARRCSPRRIACTCF
jgi:hypothetical protein